MTNEQILRRAIKKANIKVDWMGKYGLKNLLVKRD